MICWPHPQNFISKMMKQLEKKVKKLQWGKIIFLTTANNYNHLMKLYTQYYSLRVSFHYFNLLFCHAPLLHIYFLLSSHLISHSFNAYFFYFYILLNVLCNLWNLVLLLISQNLNGWVLHYHIGFCDNPQNDLR